MDLLRFQGVHVVAASLMHLQLKQHAPSCTIVQVQLTVGPPRKHTCCSSSRLLPAQRTMQAQMESQTRTSACMGAQAEHLLRGRALPLSQACIWQRRCITRGRALQRRACLAQFLDLAPLHC